MPARAIPGRLSNQVRQAIDAQPILDMHTHLYPPAFGTPLAGRDLKPADPGGLLLWGLDELLTYHYLVAEVFRIVPATTLPYTAFWAMTKRQQADHIFKHLFVERTPISEACRGVLTVLQKLGIDPADRKIDLWRKEFESKTPHEQIDRCMKLANLSWITMTNNVFDDNERERWLRDGEALRDPRFKTVLRIDPMVRDWPTASRALQGWGYRVREQSLAETARFLDEWIDRVKPIYVAVSLPPSCRYPSDATDLGATMGQNILEKVILPICAGRKLPFAMMIGSQRGVNPSLRDAGDMVGKSDVSAVISLCMNFPQNKFLVTMLSRENQHELCVAARKFGNLMPFGCWWFLNSPSLVDEITRMRLELLGASFIPQHSDARVLEQIIYKWDHSKRIIADLLCEKYADLVQTGWQVTNEEIKRDVRLLLHDNFDEFVKR